MTNFIYNMQDKLFNLNMILPVGEFSPIKKLVDHIEAQGKQLRELNAAITKRNKTIEKYEREKKELQNSVAYLSKKVNELKEGIRDSEDLTWKQKYDALLHSSEQAISALQKKCQEYKNAETDATANTIETLTRTNKELEDKVKGLEAANEKLLPIATMSLSSDLNTKTDNQRNEITRLLKNQEKLKAQITNDAGIISQLSTNNVMLLKKIGELEKEENKDFLESKKIIEKRCREAEKALEDEKQVNKDLNMVINSKNKLLDEYMTKCNKLEHNYKEEVRMKEQFKMTCFRYEVEANKLRVKIARIGGMCDDIKKIVKE